MRTLRNNPGFLVNIPSVLNEVLATEFQNTNLKRIARPMANILENDNEYGIEILAAGYNKEDFNINIEGNKLTISASLEEEKNAENTEQYSLREFYKSSFTRTFTFPKDKVNEDEIKANYTNGILLISVPKREEAKPKAPKTIAVI